MASLTLARALFANVSNHANALTPDPKEVASAAATGYIDLDFGASVSADQFFLGFLSSNITAVEAFSATGYGTGRTTRGALSLGATAARRRHAFLDLGAPVASRYWSLLVTAPATWTAGVAIIGAGVQPAWGHEWGSGRYIDDRSDVSPLRGGGYGIERGARVPGWQFTCGDLTDAEVVSLWDIVAEVGGSAPVLVSEDPAATQPTLNESLHYGLFDRPEAYTREAPALNSWSFRVRGWV